MATDDSIAEPVLHVPFRTAAVHCPRCGATELATGKLRWCRTCHGTWVPEEQLAEHVATMQAAPPQLRWSVATRPALPCAVCRRPMESLLLFDVAVERCGAHGVWFDDHELAEVLRRSAAASGRPTSAADAVEALEVLEVGADVAAVAVEVGSSGILEGVVDGVLDVLGGIFSAIDL